MALNNATAVLRSLVWLLLLQQPYLISHLLQKHKEPGTSDLIQLISASLTISTKVKWLLSSRPEVNLLSELENVGTDGQYTTENLVELNTQILTAPVNAYISHKPYPAQAKKRIQRQRIGRCIA
ncbi:hypothetical protein B0T24DRAFT_598218 [Lasiosphaeria ovina]|uniref:Uncharacterized protein n=1 Tax=Lasiosphaeria ovina TaxID=92902 RepID=A0AAE0JV23_9PEZI|nr:hypothetical protein B0T24DRAFT_598218 [Lasiosphaeria ovina]